MAIRPFCLFFGLVFAGVSAVPGQRHGRADSIQNYQSPSRNFEPVLAIRVDPSHSWLYLHSRDLAGLSRRSIEIIDPKTGRIARYEGVSVNAIRSGRSIGSELDVFRVNHWGIRDKKVYSSSKLDPNTEEVVADTLNGKRLPEVEGFRFIAMRANHVPILIREVAHLEFR